MDNQPWRDIQVYFLEYLTLFGENSGYFVFSLDLHMFNVQVLVEPNKLKIGKSITSIEALNMCLEII